MPANLDKNHFVPSNHPPVKKLAVMPKMRYMQLEVGRVAPPDTPALPPAPATHGQPMLMPHSPKHFASSAGLLRRFPLSPFFVISVIAHGVLLLALPEPKPLVQPDGPTLFSVRLVRPPAPAAPTDLHTNGQPTPAPHSPPDTRALPVSSGTAAPTAAPRETTVSLHDPVERDSWLQEYLAYMRSRIDGVWDYPGEARPGRLEGMSTVRFSVDAGGRVVRVELVASSGHAVLDHASEAAIRQAQPFLPLPADAGLERLTVLASFHYSLYGD
jgi:TonB family protein